MKGIITNGLLVLNRVNILYISVSIGFGIGLVVQKIYKYKKQKCNRLEDPIQLFWS